jgi:hypothetical protein
MPTYAFYPASQNQRRSDGLNFAVAVGVNAAAARAVAESLIGEQDALAAWNAVDLTSAPAAFVHGLPVGAQSQSVWPSLDRGGSSLKGG